MITKEKKVKKPPKEIKLELGRKDVAIIKNKAVLKQKDNSVDEAIIINVLEFLSSDDRIHFVNELCRVLKQGAKASIVSYYWCSSRAFGDLALEWPPVSESWFFHLNNDWRKANNPYESRYTCDFDTTWGYGMHQLIQSRNQEYQQHAIIFWKEAAQDLAATLIKR